MKKSIISITLLTLVSLSACSTQCPYSGDDKASSCCAGKCEKEGCGAKAEGKTCGEEAGAEKKSCCGK